MLKRSYEVYVHNQYMCTVEGEEGVAEYLLLNELVGLPLVFKGDRVLIG